MTQIASQQINKVLQLVTSMESEGDLQLSTLLWALIVACRVTKVEKAVLIHHLNVNWDRPMEFAPLSQLKGDA